MVLRLDGNCAEVGGVAQDVMGPVQLPRRGEQTGGAEPTDAERLAEPTSRKRMASGSNPLNRLPDPRSST
jgi:hypothetical protein